MSRPGRQPRKPSYLQFYPTLRCNFSCPFCFNRGLPGMADTDPAAFEKMVAAAKGEGIGHIDFLGGEPTLHPEIETLVGMIQTAGMMTTMSSNGTRPETLERLSRAFPENALRIGVSVNSAPIGKPLLDYIHAHRPIIKRLYADDCENAEADLFFGIDGDYPDLRLIYRDAVSVPDLAACADFNRFHTALARMSPRFPGLKGVYCSGFLPDPDHPVLEEVRCPAGTTKLAVTPGGDVYPCYLLFRYAHFKLGNLLKDGFSSILAHPALDYFRVFEKNRCPQTECGRFEQCHGGCPAVAYIFTGDLAGPDPRCCGTRNF